MPSREEMWDKVPDEVDLIVIGGGITGAGIVRDAARRGLSVVLFEQNDIAYGTSSRSSKLIHGGLRYLESYEFSLVFESVSERRVVMDLAPHLVNPLAFSVSRLSRVTKEPADDQRRHVALRRPRPVSLAQAASDAKPRARSPRKSRSSSKTACKAPRFTTTAPPMMPGSRSKRSSTRPGTALWWSTGLASMRWSKNDQGRVSGVIVKNARDGALREVKAHTVINATGPWTDEVLAMSGPRKGKMLRPTKGIHIVVEREKLPVEHAVVLFHPDRQPRSLRVALG